MFPSLRLGHMFKYLCELDKSPPEVISTQHLLNIFLSTNSPILTAADQSFNLYFTLHFNFVSSREQREATIWLRNKSYHRKLLCCGKCLPKMLDASCVYEVSTKRFVWYMRQSCLSSYCRLFTIYLLHIQELGILIRANYLSLFIQNQCSIFLSIRTKIHRSASPPSFISRRNPRMAKCLFRGGNLGRVHAQQPGHEIFRSVA